MIEDDEIKTARAFLCRCHRSSREAMSSTVLKGIIERWSGRYVGNADVIDAARSLGFAATSSSGQRFSMRTSNESRSACANMAVTILNTHFFGRDDRIRNFSNTDVEITSFPLQQRMR